MVRRGRVFNKLKNDVNYLRIAHKRDIAGVYVDLMNVCVYIEKTI